MTDDENRNQYFLARATKRLKRDMKLITNQPIPSIDVALNEDDILDWHFIIHGREGTPYEDGVYHGRLVFPPTFPFGPPKILFLTPNGRFKVNERICFSLSDFNPEEWKPAYSVTAVLRGVYDLMHETTDTISSIVATDSEREILARASMEHNRLNTSFCKLFPQLCTEQKHETSHDEFMKIETNTGQTISAHPSTENYVEAMDTENILETAPPIENTFPDFPNTRTPSPLMETVPSIENTFPDFPNTKTPSPLVETVPSIEWNKPLDIMDNLLKDSNSSNQVISDSMRSGNRIPSVIRGIIVPTGLVVNILPGEKYHSERNDNPDSNQLTNHPSNSIAKNPLLGYSFIQDVDNLSNNGFEVFKTHKDDSITSTSIPYMHKACQKEDFKQVEEDIVLYSKPGIRPSQICFYFVAFLILILACICAIIFAGLSNNFEQYFR